MRTDDMQSSSAAVYCAKCAETAVGVVGLSTGYV